MNNMLQEALGDAMQAQEASPEWPTAYYLQAAVLLSLGMDSDAEETIKHGAKLEAKRKTRTWYINYHVIYCHIFFLNFFLQLGMFVYFFSLVGMWKLIFFVLCSENRVVFKK